MPSRFEEGVCGVCSRTEVGIGYAPKTSRRDHPTMWVCDDPACIEIARNSYEMKQDHFTRIESLAAQDGGAEAGQYLDEIGLTDLASLTIDQYCEFCRRLVGGYRKALQAKLRDEAPF